MCNTTLKTIETILTIDLGLLIVDHLQKYRLSVWVLALPEKHIEHTFEIQKLDHALNNEQFWRQF